MKTTQQYDSCLMVRRDQNVTPKANWDDVCLSIIQDLAQAVVVVEGEYYEFLENE